MKALVGLVLLFAVCPIVHSQSTGTAPTPATPSRTKLYFTCQCDDDVAARFASAFRDILATSPRYVATDEPSETVPGAQYPQLHWHFVVVSLDISNGSGSSTALSEVLLLRNGFYMTQWVQGCGREKVADCAQTAFASIDKFVNSK